VFSSLVTSYLHRFCPANRLFFDWVIFVEGSNDFLKERARACPEPLDADLLSYFLANLHERAVLEQAIDFIHSHRAYFCDVLFMNDLKNHLFSRLEVKSLVFVGPSSDISENDQAMVGYLATLPAHAVCLTADRDFYIHANSSATYYRQFFRVLQHKSRCCRAPFGAFGIGNLSRYTASFNQVNLDWLATSQRVIALEIKVKGTNGDFAKAQRALAMVRSESNHLRLRAQGALMAALICAGENMLRGFAFGVLSILKSDYTQTSSAFTTTRLTSSGLIAILVLVNELATVHITVMGPLT
jgi:hypothetical protein